MSLNKEEKPFTFEDWLRAFREQPDYPVGPRRPGQVVEEETQDDGKTGEETDQKGSKFNPPNEGKIIRD